MSELEPCSVRKHYIDKPGSMCRCGAVTALFLQGASTVLVTLLDTVQQDAIKQMGPKP